MGASDRYAVKLGVVPTERHRFGNVEKTAAARQRVLNKLQKMGVDFATIDDVTDNGLAYAFNQVEPIVRKLKEANVDGLFIPHCNFGTEEVVCHIAKELGKPVLLWGERDGADRSNWQEVTDRQCGVFATGKVLRRMGVPFTYMVNCSVDDNTFAARTEEFLGVLAVVKAFTHLRIGQIGTRPTPFLSMMVNEAELLEQFGIRVVPVSLVDIIEDAKGLWGTPEQAEQVRQFRARIPLFEGDADSVARMAALKLAVTNWAERNECNAVVIQCWSALQRAYGVGTCFVNSWISDEGLPVACETDIHGAISSVLLEAASLGRTPSFLADLTVRHPTNENAELLWHCGPFPFRLWDKVSPAKVAVGGQANWRIKGGDITVARFDGDRGVYHLAVGLAHGVEGPETFGTYLWAEVRDWPAWERRFAEGPYVHHVAAIHSRVADVLTEATQYMPRVFIDRLP